MSSIQAKQPKNKRLTIGDRDVIMEFAKSRINATADSAELNAAYEKAADAISGKVKADNPPKDMAVLERFGLADRDACVYVSTGGSNYNRFTFREGDKRIALRAYRRGGCGRNPIGLDGEAEAAVDAFFLVQEQNEKLLRKRYSDFRELISQAKSFNELAALWPAIEGLRSKIVGTGTAISILSADMIERIATDPAFQEAA